MKYAEQVVTTIKSICCYNKNIKFYLFNRDFSPEWFDYLNSKLQKLNSEIIDIKINNEQIKKYPILAHINSDTAYYRYFIPQYVSEEKVLYLDCDLVVNGKLDHVFDIDLGNYFLGASSDVIAKKFHQLNHFNSGVMLINNKKWQQQNATQHLLDLTEKYQDIITDGDQSILNVLFSERWFELNQNFNYLVGKHWVYQNHQLPVEDPMPENTVPLILHYNSPAKPWLSGYQIPYRDVYWFYYGLDWGDIFQRH